MHPILLEIGPIIIYSMWFLAALGIIAGGAIFIHLSKGHKLKLNFILDHSFWIIISGLIGARFFFVIQNTGYYFYQFHFENLLSIFYIWDKGLSPWGAISGIVLALIYFCKKDGQPILRWLDILFISIIVALVFGNIGTFLEGSIGYGKETAMPWGIKIESPIIKYSIPIHPTQLYATLYSLIIAITSIIAFSKKIFDKDGNIFLFGTLSYSIIRFLEEFLRGDDVFMLFWLREGQIVALLSIISICIVLLFRYNKLKFPNIGKRWHS